MEGGIKRLGCGGINRAHKEKRLCMETEWRGEGFVYFARLLVPKRHLVRHPAY